MIDLASLMWIVTGTSILGTVANIYKKPWCFKLWFFTNATWMCYDFVISAYAQSALFAVYTGLAVIGIVKWGEKS